jgi:hypothetical protein
VAEATEGFDLKEQVAHVDQMFADAARSRVQVDQLLADATRKRQEIGLAPWALALSSMVVGAALFAVGLLALCAPPRRWASRPSP